MNPALMRAIAEHGDTIARPYQHDPALAGFMSHFATVQAMIEALGNSNDLRFQSYYSLVAEYTEGPRRQGIILPEGFEVMTPNECYGNCFNVVLDHTDVTYVEGYAQATSMPTNHAWLEHDDGTIIDPTWANLAMVQEVTYLGIKFDTDFVIRRVREVGYTSILNSDWRAGTSVLATGFVTDNGVVVDMGEV
jgi:hypothetical protein